MNKEEEDNQRIHGKEIWRKNWKQQYPTNAGGRWRLTAGQDRA